MPPAGGTTRTDFRTESTEERVGKASVLVIEDEAKISEVLRLYLEKDGYQVDVAADGDAALDLFRRKEPDLLILDLNLPRLDGMEVCRRLRSQSTVPIIMLTARDEEIDKLLGLECGADDYITKPFSPREVVARVRAVLRRTAPPPADGVLRVGQLALESKGHEVRRAHAPLDLTPTEFRLLEALMRNRGQVLSRQQLLDQAQGEAFEGYERTIDAHIKNLRQKIEDDPRRPSYLLTVYGVGYKLVG